MFSTYLPSRQVTAEEAKDYALSQNMEYSEVSAKAGHGI